jgi:hypothetical protein
MLRGLATGVLCLLAYLTLSPLVTRYRGAWLAHRTGRQIESAYRHLKSYQDTFDITAEIGLGGTRFPVRGSGSVLFERPDKVNLVMKSTLTPPEFEVRLLNDGRTSWVYAPSLNQYQVSPTVERPAPFDLSESLAQQVGPLRVLPLYRLFLEEPALGRFLKDAHNVQYGGYADLDGQRVRILRWDQAPGPFLGALGLTSLPSDHARIPVTAWVGSSNYLVVRLRMDLSHWAPELVGPSPDLPVSGLILTESHKIIQTSPRPFKSARFNFEPPAESQPVARFNLPAPNLSTLAAPRRQFLKSIPARLPQAPPGLIDLSEYYNGSLVQAWHPGNPDHTLEVLPRGLLQLGDVAFDVRGVVQLSGRLLRDLGGRFPQEITGIKVAQTCRQLHFLHAAGWSSPDGTRIGAYRVHYADGQEQSIPIVYGEDVRDWNAQSDRNTKLRRSKVAWNGVNKAKLPVRLFKTTWVNPLPETEIVSVDFLSTMADAAPFLVAVTAEP